jgi:hypothetical protein
VSRKSNKKIIVTQEQPREDKINLVKAEIFCRVEIRHDEALSAGAATGNVTREN